MTLFQPDPRLAGAPCAGKSKLFYPEGRGSCEAKAICRECPIKNPCLEVALETDETYGYRWGIWAGMTATERDRRFGKVEVPKV